MFVVPPSLRRLSYQFGIRAYEMQVPRFEEGYHSIFRPALHATPQRFKDNIIPTLSCSALCLSEILDTEKTRQFHGPPPVVSPRINAGARDSNKALQTLASSSSGLYTRSRDELSSSVSWLWNLRPYNAILCCNRGGWIAGERPSSVARRGSGVCGVVRAPPQRPTQPPEGSFHPYCISKRTQ